MQGQLILSNVECLYRFAKAGLIHAKRSCSFCNAPMKITETPNMNYPVCMVWRCTLCFEKKSVLADTPLNYMNLQALNLSLSLFVEGTKPYIARRLSKHALGSHYVLFRRAASHYMAKNIQPYLKFPSIMEVDETFIGATRFSMLNPFPQIRWVFGMHCRQTKLAVMYYLKDKNHNSIVPLIKRHIPNGGVLFSDMHSMYVNMHTCKSKLSPYGIYHMWTNHSETMVHYKFRFLHTLNIEREWLHLKRKFSLITFAQSAKAIQDWCNLYTIHKGMLRPECRYDFWLRMIKYYYYDLIREFREGIPDNDTLYPSIAHLEEAIAYKNNPTFRRMVHNWDSATSYLQANPNRHGLLYKYYNSEDLEQILQYPNEEDIDPSIRNLARRRRKTSRSSQLSAQVVSASGKKFHYIPIYPQFSNDLGSDEIQDFGVLTGQKRLAKRENEIDVSTLESMGHEESDEEMENMTNEDRQLKMREKSDQKLRLYRAYIRRLRINHLSNIDYWMRPQAMDTQQNNSQCYMGENQKMQKVANARLPNHSGIGARKDFNKPNVIDVNETELDASIMRKFRTPGAGESSSAGNSGVTGSSLFTASDRPTIDLERSLRVEDYQFDPNEVSAHRVKQQRDFLINLPEPKKKWGERRVEDEMVKEASGKKRQDKEQRKREEKRRRQEVREKKRARKAAKKAKRLRVN